MNILCKELYGRDSIRAAKWISNPGCYATSSQLLIAPLIPYLAPGAGSLPTVFGISGYSGAGTIAGTTPNAEPVTIPRVSPESLGGGIRAYTLTDHIHEREAGYHLSKLLPREATESEGIPATGTVPLLEKADYTNRLKIAFIPHVAPWFSGILSTLSCPLSTSTKLSARDMQKLYTTMYAGEELIKVKENGSVPVLGEVENKHGWVVGGFQVHSEGGRVVVVVSSSC